MKEYKYTINGNKYTVGIGDIDDGIAQVTVNGTPYKVELEKSAVTPVKTVSAPRPAAAPRENLSKPAPAPSAGGYQVTSPLPGTVVSIQVKVGDTVKAADTVAILEAMKMENAIHAGRDGKVTAISANAGDAVLEGTPLITIG